MKWTSLDSIVCSTLINRGYPVHYYFQFLKLATDCLRELNFTTLGNIKTQKLLLNDYYAAKLPNDYVDYVKIGYPVGQYVKPMGSRGGLTRLNEYDTNGNKILHTDNTQSNTLNGWTGYWYHNVINSNGENVGRGYGSSGGNRYDNFKILKERGEIQFNEHVATDYIILEYISDGLEADNATKVTPYAQGCIEAYIIWKMKDYNRNISRGEVADEERKYFNQLRYLRARMADWTTTEILRTVRQTYSIKS